MADYSDPQRVAELANIDPELEQLLKDHPLPAPDWGNVEKMREMRKQMEATRAPNAEQAKLEHTFTIPMRDGYQSEVRIHKPARPPAKSPLVVLFFGGGFVVGSPMQLSPFSRALAQLFGATVVNLNYRLAPEHKFPTPINDAWDSVKWLASNASSMGADTSAGFVVGGVSAGGNLAANVVQTSLKERLSAPITGAWLCIPVLLNNEIVPENYRPLFFSKTQNANAPVFDSKVVDRVEEFLQPDWRSPLWSPFNVAGAHTGFPPSYVQVCGMDPLRDDGLIYEAVLREHGVKTKLDAYPGVPHAHFSYLPSLGASKKAIVDVVKGIGWLLGCEVSDKEVAGVVAPPAGG